MSRQIRHAQEVLRSSDPLSRQLLPVASLEAGRTKSPNSLHPTDDPFYPFANPLAEIIRGVSGGPAVDGGAAAPCGVGGQLPFAPDRIQGDQQQGFQYRFRRYGWAARSRSHLVKDR
jgi:hypothetical protein